MSIPRRTTVSTTTPRHVTTRPRRRSRGSGRWTGSTNTSEVSSLDEGPGQPGPRRRRVLHSFRQSPRANGLMRRSLLVLTTALVLLLRLPAHGQGLAFDVFRDYMEALRVQTGIPGLAAAIVGSDGILWERAYGRQDVG